MRPANWNHNFICTKFKCKKERHIAIGVNMSAQLRSSVNGVARKKKIVFNPLIPKSGWLLISHYNITLKSDVKLMRIKEMITNLGSS